MKTQYGMALCSRSMGYSLMWTIWTGVPKRWSLFNNFSWPFKGRCFIRSRIKKKKRLVLTKRKENEGCYHSWALDIYTYTYTWRSQNNMIGWSNEVLILKYIRSAIESTVIIMQSNGKKDRYLKNEPHLWFE